MRPTLFIAHCVFTYHNVSLNFHFRLPLFGRSAPRASRSFDGVGGRASDVVSVSVVVVVGVVAGVIAGVETIRAFERQRVFDVDGWREQAWRSKSA